VAVVVLLELTQALAKTELAEEAVLCCLNTQQLWQLHLLVEFPKLPRLQVASRLQLSQQQEYQIR
jgi:hypothetical protein